MMKVFAARLATWGQSRTALRELSRLSDRELDDLGIGRADIRAVASGAPLMTSSDVEAVLASRFAPTSPAARVPSAAFDGTLRRAA